ncbi:MAG: polysaccharide deacetylase family protein [Candidatus Omnitrophica bacterium]|nr:polysaccharide deacetylase family protein [Candidatus Omnitrophota bacterium]
MKTAQAYKKNIKSQISNLIHKSKKLDPGNHFGFRALVYHLVVDRPIENEWDEQTTPKDLFESQMKYLCDNQYNVLSCTQALRYLINRENIPPKTIAITFDDGYKDNYTNALPVLKKYNFPATLFLTADLLRDYSGRENFLSRSELLEMKDSGIIDFGCHGLTHRALTLLDEQRLNEEIRTARQRLEEITGGKIELFAYPFGHSGSYNQDVVNKVRREGFLGAFTATFGLNHPKIDIFLLRRNRISWLDDLSEFEKHLSGAYDWYALWQSFSPKRYHFNGD